MTVTSSLAFSLTFSLTSSLTSSLAFSLLCLVGLVQALSQSADTKTSIFELQTSPRDVDLGSFIEHDLSVRPHS
jgi:hypothetical protein